MLPVTARNASYFFGVIFLGVQEAFADLLGIGLSTLRSWEQRKREPSGAARMLIAIAIKHPGVLQEAVA